MIVVVPAIPPRPGTVFPEIAATEGFTPGDAVRLYTAALQDTLASAEAAGGQLLVNYLPDQPAAAGSSPAGDEQASDGEQTTDGEQPTGDRQAGAGDTVAESDQSAAGHLPADPEAAVRTIASEALMDVTDARFERQVGSSVAARIGNTVTHLLTEEDADSVAVVRPIAPLVRRSIIDGGAMKLRSNEVVLGPTTAGGVYFAGFTEPIDFGGAFGPSELGVVTDRGRDAGHDVEFLRHVPRVDTTAGLCSTVPTVRSRVRAERIVPAETATAIHELGVAVRDGRLVRDESAD